MYAKELKVQISLLIDKTSLVKKYKLLRGFFT
jgi:hypothetical protein